MDGLSIKNATDRVGGKKPATERPEETQNNNVIQDVKSSLG